MAAVELDVAFVDGELIPEVAVTVAVEIDVAEARVTNVVDITGPDDQIVALFVFKMTTFPFPTTSEASEFPVVPELQCATLCQS